MKKKMDDINITTTTTTTTPVSRYHFDEFEYRQEDITTKNNSRRQQEDTIEDKIPEILKAFETDRVLVLTGDTGCGKTTKIPKLLMDRFKNIICTQPRRLAAINTAKRISKNLNCALGSIVGYTIRCNNVTSKDTVLRIVTDGILLNEITNNKNSKKKFVVGYDLIIIDEAHERSLNIDFLLGYFKNVMLKDKRIETRVLIMSATLHTEKFIRYFDNCPLVEIKCRRYNIDHFYLKEEYSSNPYYLTENVVNTVMNILKRDDNDDDGGDILIFLPGQFNIDSVDSLLYDCCCETNQIDNVSILKLHSLLPQDEQDLIFQQQQQQQEGNNDKKSRKRRRRKRKIILSTNIAETSITIKNIKFIIDSGKVKIMQKSLNTQSLVEKNISKAQAKQRAGRTGRTQPGIVFRLYSQNFYDNEMDEDPEPEILRSNLSSIILSLKKIGIRDILNFQFIDEIPPNSIRSTVNFLKSIGALVEDEEEESSSSSSCIGERETILTRIGKQISYIPLDPEMAKCLHVANRLGCVKSVSIIIAFLNNPNLFINIKRNHPNYHQYLLKKNKFNHSNGDFFTFLNIYKEWSLCNFSSKFLEFNYLNSKTMYEIKYERDKLLKCFRPSSSSSRYIYDDYDNYYYNNDNNDNIKQAFFSGFFKNVAESSCCFDDGDKYYKLLLDENEDCCKIDKRDGLYGRSTPPDYILFIQLNIINGEKKYMRYCLEIDQILYDLAKEKCIKYNLF